MNQSTGKILINDWTFGSNVVQSFSLNQPFATIKHKIEENNFKGESQ
jgi:hypothetical protein